MTSFAACRWLHAPLHVSYATAASLPGARASARPSACLPACVRLCVAAQRSVETAALALAARSIRRSVLVDVAVCLLAGKSFAYVAPSHDWQPSSRLVAYISHVHRRRFHCLLHFFSPILQTVGRTLTFCFVSCCFHSHYSSDSVVNVVLFITMYNACIAAIIKQLNTTLAWPVLAHFIALHKICMLLLISANAILLVIL